jgi:hypothetical protein
VAIGTTTLDSVKINLIGLFNEAKPAPAWYRGGVRLPGKQSEPHGLVIDTQEALWLPITSEVAGAAKAWKLLLSDHDSALPA